MVNPLVWYSGAGTRTRWGWGKRTERLDHRRSPGPLDVDPRVVDDDHLGRAGGSGAAHGPPVRGDRLRHRLGRGREALVEEVGVLRIDDHTRGDNVEDAPALPVGQVPAHGDDDGPHLPTGKTSHKVLGRVAQAHGEVLPHLDASPGQHPGELGRAIVQLPPGDGSLAPVLGGEDHADAVRVLRGHFVDLRAEGHALVGRHRCHVNLRFLSSCTAPPRTLVLILGAYALTTDPVRPSRPARWPVSPTARRGPRRCSLRPWPTRRHTARRTGSTTGAYRPTGC